MEKKYIISTHYERLIADVVTPVSIYLNIRDKFAGAIMLESSDYHSDENSFSYICFNPIASFEMSGKSLKRSYPDGKIDQKGLSTPKDAIEELQGFAQTFKSDNLNFDFISNGLFGYIAYEAVQYFEDITFDQKKKDEYNIPDILYKTYRNIIAINHFNSEMYVFDHCVEGVHNESNLSEIISLIKSKNFAAYHFEKVGDESSNFNDTEFLGIIKKGKGHCHRGDVFQIVLSRRFQNKFKGDEFNVYRALRAINPSPYLFFFDYGSFKIFGSSPEAQIVVKDGEASIYPIAGTFRRSGNDMADAELAQKLSEDVKENSEHIMLVDLARNDLSRSGEDVEVETFKEIQYYSHVIHLVSKVTGKLNSDTQTAQIVADTCPAGTLSGAPKHMAMELIDQYEPTKRGYYGGAIGYFGFDGNFNHAIMIRSFLSKNNTLFYQAGAGVVAKSKEENELQEVNNKLAALKAAIAAAGRIKN